MGNVVRWIFCSTIDCHRKGSLGWIVFRIYSITAANLEVDSARTRGATRIDVNRANSASNKVAQVQASLVKFQQTGHLDGGRSKDIGATEAAESFQWARERMESLAARERGEDSNYRDADPKSGSVQSDFYHKTIDATFEGDKNGKFRFTEVRHDEDLMFGTLTPPPPLWWSATARPSRLSLPTSMPGATVLPVCPA